MEPLSQKRCPKCNAEVSESAYFCSNCGQALKPKPVETSIGKQIVIYAISFFLAPFGLGYAIKYLKQADKKAKIIGLISLVLTVVSIALFIEVAKSFFEQQYSALDVITTGGL